MRSRRRLRHDSAHPPLDSYLRDILRTPLLSAEEERELGYRVAAGDPEARDHLARANLRLVVSIARSFVGQGLPLPDLIEEGNLGLLRAVEGFDPSMNTRFGTYAGFWIKQSIRRALFNMGRTVRLPAHLHHLLIKWRRTVNELQKELGRPPAEEEVARRLGLRRKKLAVVRKALHLQTAGPQGAGGDDGPGSIDETLPDDRARTPDRVLAEAEELRRALDLLGELNQREALVLRLRFGLDGQDPLSLQEVGNRLGVTRERVRQIEREALAELAGRL